jgi:transcriptional regulator with XRE-family HTH domain
MTARTPEPLFRTLVGRVLRRVRAAEHRTLQDVATQARISIAYLSEVERGRKEASSEVLVAICRALDIRLVDLLAETTGELLAADLATGLRDRRRRLVDLTGTTVSTAHARSADAGPTVRLQAA